MTSQSVQVWQGQFPPPEAVEKYEAIAPGTFNRLIAMAEPTMEAQIEAQKEARLFLSRDTARGHYLGAAVAIAALLAAGFCAYIKQPWVAGACVGVPVLAVARAFIDSMKGQPASTAVAIASHTPAQPGASAPSTPEKPDESSSRP